MKPDTQNEMLIEQRLANEGKSIAAAYFLWALCGLFGGHRFYLDKTGSATAMLLLTLAGWFTAAIFIGLLPLLIVSIWGIADAFLIPRMVRASKESLRQYLISEMAFFSDNSVRAAGA